MSHHPSLASFDTLDILQLIRSENVGPVTFFQLINRFGTVRGALDALPELARRGGMKRRFNLAARGTVEKEYALTERFGATFLRYGDENYPTLLTHIADAPPLLTLRGSSKHWQQKRCIAMVGSRNASAGGCSITRKLARQCGELGLTVVSGLARGIDTAAHQGALAYGTVGVIAGGIDNIYPPENAKLYEAMANEGAILSENAFAASPQARNFPSRNRIIAGMCEGLLVVEAAPKSGSLISARYALDYNREVMAIPGSPLDPRSRGTNGLIKQGAQLIESAEDIVETLHQAHWQRPNTELREGEPREFESQSHDEQSIDSARSVIEEKLGSTPIQLDELVRETHIPIALVQSALLEIELAARLERSPGGKVALRFNEDEIPSQATLV